VKVLKIFGLAAMLSGIACAPTRTPSPAVSAGVSSSASAGQQQDWKDIQRVELQAKGIVHTDKCANPGECRTAPVGVRACGGPRYYLTYCAASTDTAELTRLLTQVRNMEAAYNRKWAIVSTCEYRNAPSLRVSGGYCQEIGGSSR
jgi:hypothetical protein